MTAVEVRLSPRAVIALREYKDRRGLSVDDAAEEMILRGGGSEEARVAAPPTAEEFEGNKRIFLRLLRDLGSVSGACSAAVIAEGLPYSWAWTDIEFARAFDAARADIRTARKPDLATLV